MRPRDSGDNSAGPGSSSIFEPLISARLNKSGTIDLSSELMDSLMPSFWNRTRNPNCTVGKQREKSALAPKPSIFTHPSIIGSILYFLYDSCILWYVFANRSKAQPEIMSRESPVGNLGLRSRARNLESGQSKTSRVRNIEQGILSKESGVGNLEQEIWKWESRAKNQEKGL